MEPTISTLLEVAGRTVVAVRGEIDLVTAPAVEQHLLELLAAGRRHLVVVLEDVTFIDSTGMNALAAALHRARDLHGSLRLVCTDARILKILAVTGLPTVLPVHHSVGAALGADVTDERRGPPGTGL